MMDQQLCDICGRPEAKRKDEDGLWICNPCYKQIKSQPKTQDFDDTLDEALQPLIGKSAGAICRTLELPFVPPFDTVIEAALIIAYDQDLYMSAWLFVSQWQNGTTTWLAPNGQANAQVTTDGKVYIQDY